VNVAMILSWMQDPKTGLDKADASALIAAMDSLDTISSGHRTDAFRMLAARYQDDLLKMVDEDRKR